MRLTGYIILECGVVVMTHAYFLPYMDHPEAEPEGIAPGKTLHA